MTREQLLALGARLKPLRDRVIVSRLEYEHPVLAVVGVTLQKGLVIAVGNGRRLRRKTRFEGPNGRKIPFYDGPETGKIRPMRVKVGQCVEFSPRMLIEFIFEGVSLLMVEEQACYGTTNDSQSQALLWQQSAGYDREGNWMSGKETAI